ncbi:hypothetical protein HPB50_026985 [Hyalomma asiaticum]|uniref:Uncharacterized protein n=1 Tax=Hyalomma asiaticum TaxID=266040 RepID=A0ACB7SAP1_HYAAI|nr:hypothetical protein HPB50_026985 [Hyalomma asiaticum]
MPYVMPYSSQGEDALQPDGLGNFPGTEPIASNDPAYFQYGNAAQQRLLPPDTSRGTVIEPDELDVHWRPCRPTDTPPLLLPKNSWPRRDPTRQLLPPARPSTPLEGGGGGGSYVLHLGPAARRRCGPDRPRAGSSSNRGATPEVKGSRTFPRARRNRIDCP